MAILGLGTADAGLIERALTDTAGVVRAYVNADVEMVYVEYDPAIARPTDLVASIVRAGFQTDELSTR